MNRFKKILFVCGVEGDTELSFQRAVELALHNNGQLTVMDVVEGTSSRKIHAPRRLLAGKLLDIMRRERLARLERMVAPIREENSVNKVRVKVATGHLFVEVIKEVLREEHDLVIKSCSDSKGIKSRIFGSDDMHLLRKCHCPVWIVKDGKEKRFKKILAPLDILLLDGDREREKLNQQILDMASSLAITESAELHLAHGYYFFGEDYMRRQPSSFTEQEITQWREDEQKSCRLKLEELAATIEKISKTDRAEPKWVHIHLKNGDPKEIIPQLAQEKQIDLVVMGTVSRSGIAGFFIGNTAESILNDINCSVLAVKPVDFVSPVTLEK